MKKVHLDTDLGGDPDDLCALAMLLKYPDVEITGITTVSEKEGKRAGYTKYALKLAEREDVPVKAGAEVSGGYFNSNCGLPIESEYWPEPISAFTNELEEALELIRNSIEQGSIIIGIGPYTNFYLLDKKYPGILKNAKLYLMGGFIYPVREGFPKWGNDSDWNIQVDIKSAKYVLENSNPTLVPLTVTVETGLKRSHLPSLRQSGKLGEIMATQAEALDREYKNDEKYGVLNFHHDPLTCAISLGWNDGVTIEEIPLRFEVKDSLLVEQIDKSCRPTKVVTQIDGDKFNEFWLQTVTTK